MTPKRIDGTRGKTSHHWRIHMLIRTTFLTNCPDCEDFMCDESMFQYLELFEATGPKIKMSFYSTAVFDSVLICGGFSQREVSCPSLVWQNPLEG